MLASEGPVAILPPPAGKQARVTAGALAFEVKLGGPLSSNAVLNFGIRREIRMLARAGRTDRGRGCYFQVARLFHVMVVAYEVGGLLSVSGLRAEWQGEQENEGQAARAHRQELVEIEIHFQFDYA